MRTVRVGACVVHAVSRPRKADKLTLDSEACTMPGMSVARGGTTARAMSDSQSRDGSRRASRRLRFIVGGAIIVAVIGWLVLSNVLGSTTPYLEVTEVKAAGPSERLVRAVGVARAIEWDPQATLLRFEISDDEELLAVEYKGVRPDLLVEGTRTVVEGRYTASGIFRATKVLLKCPSKYEEE